MVRDWHSGDEDCKIYAIRVFERCCSEVNNWIIISLILSI